MECARLHTLIYPAQLDTARAELHNAIFFTLALWTALQVNQDSLDGEQPKVRDRLRQLSNPNIAYQALECSIDHIIYALFN
jgi:hypothetical protein